MTLPRESTPLRLVIFASGRGSNAENLFQMAREFPSLYQIVHLICDQENALVLEICEQYAIEYSLCPLPSKSIDKETRRKVHETDIIKILDTISFDYICLAGYMRILSADFISRYPHPHWSIPRIVNIHPSLLPEFKGLHAYQQAFHSASTSLGVTTHFVTEHVDDGPIILQYKFTREEHDSLDSFMEKGLQTEHRCYRNSIRLLQEAKQLSLSQSEFVVQCQDHIANGAL